MEESCEYREERRIGSRYVHMCVCNYNARRTECRFIHRLFLRIRAGGRGSTHFMSPIMSNFFYLRRLGNFDANELQALRLTFLPPALCVAKTDNAQYFAAYYFIL
jgi:hypothetical protein